MESKPLYSLRVPDVYRALETSTNGLNETEVAERRSLYGENLLSAPAPPQHLRSFLRQITHTIALIEWGAGLLAFLAHRPVLGLIIWSLVLLNAAFSFWREFRTEQAMDALRRLMPSYARVLRHGVQLQVPTSEVVPGDILVLSEGDNIPADARVVEAFGLRTNNATLTGEALPVRKTSDASLREDLSEVEQPNLVFVGTSVVSGTAKAVVFATGMLTQFGRIATLTQNVVAEPSPIQREIWQLRRVLGWVALGTGAVVLVVGMLDVGLNLATAGLLALGIIVAVLPEGLPAVLTLSLAVAGQRLAARGVLVKELAVIETLGTVSIICTDKSGTLTQNQMTVREVWVAGERLSVTGVGYEPLGAYRPPQPAAALAADLTQLGEAALLCNNSRLIPPSPEKPQWSGLGDQTEVALRVAALKAGVDEAAVSAALPRSHEIPFDPRRKRMTTLHRRGSSEVAFVKGAPREVLQLCTHILIHGKRQPLTEALRAEILAANDDFARSALRVLALARREDLPTGPGARLRSMETVERDLTFLGLMAMMDPPRPEVTQAVQVCREAGIRMVMITGDYGLTAESLARRVGMLTGPSPIILTGAEVEAMNDVQLGAALQNEVIFARMAPEHKLRLVAIFQSLGEVVAVTGDGVNDAPALRKADVGVVMGLTGTDVAKEAADLILTDDNFAQIVTAIEEGRGLYDNLRKFMTYLFSSNVPEVMPFIFSALFNIPLALTVMQLLAIDMGTDLLPALALGVERPEPNVMRRPPRRKSQPLIDRFLLRRAYLWLGAIETTLCFIGFFAVYAWVGGIEFWTFSLREWAGLPAVLRAMPPSVYALAVTVYHAGVVTAQVGNAYACRTEREHGWSLGYFSNPTLLWGILAELVIIGLLIYVPPLARLFDHVPLPLYFWPWLLLYAPILYGLEWLRKLLMRRDERPQTNPGLD